MNDIWRIVNILLLNCQHIHNPFELLVASKPGDLLACAHFDFSEVPASVLKCIGSLHELQRELLEFNR